MKIERKNDFMEISDVHPNDYFYILSGLTSIYNILKGIELDSFADNQDKERLQIELERILNELSLEKGSKNAESYPETIIRKVIEKMDK